MVEWGLDECHAGYQIVRLPDLLNIDNNTMIFNNGLFLKTFLFVDGA